MEWYELVAHFVMALFFTNAIPHFVQGVSGQPFPSPFSSPMGRAPSPPVLNVVWATINVAIAVTLFHLVPIPDPWPVSSMVAISAGIFITAVGLAIVFGRWQRERRAS